MPGRHPRQNHEQTRGFGMLIGKTIVSVDTGAINDVVITCIDGTKFDINADELHAGIPVLECLDVT